jgi:hypothetical protein
MVAASLLRRIFFRKRQQHAAATVQFGAAHPKVKTASPNCTPVFFGLVGAVSRGTTLNSNLTPSHSRY